MRSVFTFILSFVVLLFNGCATTGGSTPKTPPESSESSTPSKSFYTLQGRNYSFAIYNDAHRLLTHPLEDLLAEMKWREMAGQENISDIYIISHGWNYTLSTAVANYHNYVELIDKYMHDQKEKNEKFQPYFIFITWTSSVRPLTNLTKNLLPFGLDTSVELFTNLVDKIPFHLVSGWKESLSAASIALGSHYPNHQDDPEPYGYKDDSMIIDDNNMMGRNLPVSAMIGELIKRKNSLYKGEESCEEILKKYRLSEESNDCVPFAKVKLHAIGHSYGAKLIAMASMEALRLWSLDAIATKCKICAELNLSDDSNNPRYLKDLTEKEKKEELFTSPTTGHTSDLEFLIGHEKEAILLKEFYKETAETPIESLVLFNPAFHPSELSYPVDIIFKKAFISAPIKTLKFIPRKAIVFSKYDYATGALFGLGNAVFNSQINQYFQQNISDSEVHKRIFLSKNIPGKTVLRNAVDAFLLKPIIQGPFSTLTFGYSFLYTQMGQSIYTGVNLPQDLIYHVRNGPANDSKLIPDVIKGAVNAVDYFLPTFPWGYRHESDQGLYRISRPGLGKTGLHHMAKGRWEKLNLWGLSSYMTKESFGKRKCSVGEAPNGDCIDTKTHDDNEYPFAPNIDANTFKTFTASTPECVPIDNKNSECAFKDFELERPERSELLWQREKFYSFDASEVFNTWIPPAGAHGDLRETKKNKRDHTFNFVLHFTKTNFNSTLKK